MTPEALIKAVVTAVLEYESAPKQKRASARTRGKVDSRNATRVPESSQIPSPASPDEPMLWDGQPIPPILRPDQVAEIEAALAGTAPAGYRMPGEGDDQGGARL